MAFETQCAMEGKSTEERKNDRDDIDHEKRCQGGWSTWRRSPSKALANF
jgi:hypothetical protein